MVDLIGFEPMPNTLQECRSPTKLQARVVCLPGLEPGISTLSEWRLDQFGYRHMDAEEGVEPSRQPYEGRLPTEALRMGVVDGTGFEPVLSAFAGQCFLQLS